MKSLEHIIRDIREGKCCCDKKKDSLEHAIRKVANKEYESSTAAKDSKPIEEAVGTIGTDKYQGNEFKSIRTATPHIKPPAGEGSHSQAPENASRQRSIAKEKAGINRVEEENVDEATVLSVPGMGAALAAGFGAYTAYKAGKSLPDVYAAGKKGVESFSNKIDKAINPSKEDLERAQKAIQSKSVAAPAIDKPAEVQTEPEKKKKEEQPAAPPTKVAEPKAPAAEKPAEVSAPAIPKAATPTATPAAVTPAETPAAAKPVAVPAASTPASVSSPAAVTPKVAAAAAATTAALSSTTPGQKKGVSLGGGGSISSGGTAFDAAQRVKTQTHFAKPHKRHATNEDTETRKQIENMPRKGDRKSIEYVGRKDADPKTTKEKTSRLATIKNVIDEAKKEVNIKKINSEDGKTRAYDYGEDLLVINPDQRKINLDVDNGEKTPKDYDNK